MGTAHAHPAARRHLPPVPTLAASIASSSQLSTLHAEGMRCRTAVVETRLPHLDSSILKHRQAQTLDVDCLNRHGQREVVEARLSHPHGQHVLKSHTSCQGVAVAQLPPERVCVADTWDEWGGRKGCRHVGKAALSGVMVKARPSHLHDLSPLSLMLFLPFKHQMRWPFGIKEVIATIEVARRPSTFAASATPSVAARLPTHPLAAAACAAARLVTMSWLTRSDREMEEQIENALYQRGRMIEVYSAGFQTMEQRAGVHGTLPVERADQARGLNLVSAADDELVKTAIRNILPRANPAAPG